VNKIRHLWLVYVLIIAVIKYDLCSLHRKIIAVTVTVKGLVKLLAFNAHICPSKYLVYF